MRVHFVGFASAVRLARSHAKRLLSVKAAARPDHSADDVYRVKVAVEPVGVGVVVALDRDLPR